MYFWTEHPHRRHSDEATDRVEAFTGTMSLDVTDYGASIGTRISDKLAIGGTLAVYRLKMEANTSRFYYAPFTGESVSISRQSSSGVRRFRGVFRACELHGPNEFLP